MIKEKHLPHAIFLDIDGTLLGSAKATDLLGGKLSKRNIKAIKKAQSLGHKILINTGRGYSGLPLSFLDGEVKFDGFVTALGARVDVGGITLLEKAIDDKILDETVEYALNNKKGCRFQGDKSRIAISFDYDYGEQWTSVSSKEEFFNSLDGKIHKITVDSGLDGEYRNFLSERYNMYMHTESAGEGTSFGTDKAFGMMIALGFLDIPPERSIAMGDSINDVDMFNAAGTSVAMGNANDAIKAFCDMVTAANLEDGVAVALEKLLF